MRHLDLFSGVGGFALAARWAGYQTTQFVEIDPFCRRVLARNFAGVPIHDDITTFDGAGHRGAVALLTGGFPCQPYSVAGQRRGNEDDRALWPEMRRVIDEARPRWILAENVPGFIGMALDEVLADLDALGYETGSLVVPAAGVGAPHRRDRLWIVAHAKCGEGGQRCHPPGLGRWTPEAEQAGLGGGDDADTDRDDGASLRPRAPAVQRPGASEDARGGHPDQRQQQRSAECRLGRGDDGLSSGTHESGGLNAGEMGCSQTVSTTLPGRATMRGVRSNHASAATPCGLPAPGRDPVSLHELSCEGRSGRWIPSPEEDEAVRDLRQDVHAESQQEAQDVQRGVPERDRPQERDEAMALRNRWLDGTWEDTIPRTVIDQPNRSDRLKALGNAIVPQVAYEIIRRMR